MRDMPPAHGRALFDLTNEAPDGDNELNTLARASSRRRSKHMKPVVTAEERQAARRLLSSLLLSMAILAVGVVWTLRVAARSSAVNHELGHLEFAREMRSAQRAGLDASP